MDQTDAKREKSENETDNSEIPTNDQEPVTVPVPEKEKKVRRRKKALHQHIRNQMEFYFSDANLSKDRFMQKITQDDDEVDLQLFLKFNKIKKITEDLGEIAKALKYSQVLKVSGDGSKVSRITPFVPRSQAEVDNCTIYVVTLLDFLFI